MSATEQNTRARSPLPGLADNPDRNPQQNRPSTGARRLRIDARKRLTKALAEKLPEVVEGMEFHPINGDAWSAYEIFEVHSFRVVMSVKTDTKKLNKVPR